MGLYAITDIETTGGNVEGEKITEIAIFLYDGKKILDKYHSLVNPEKNIPSFITRLTGINDAMVSESPKFFEIAKDIHEFTKGATFVAHNVSFDYNFIRREFRSLGFDFSREILCTVNLSRKLIPNEKSYSLGKLCASIGISLDNHHRAKADAFATTELFSLLLTKKEALGLVLEKTKLANLHVGLSKESLADLPKAVGVYYFFDESDEVIYIGKSKNIHRRVFSHLYSNKSKKAIEMKGKIAKVEYYLCGSELVALLKESQEIKKFKPIYNRAQKKTKYPVALYAKYNVKGYAELNLAKKIKDELPLMFFNSYENAKDRLFAFVKEFDLCPKLCGLYPKTQDCFHYTIKECKGACVGEEAIAIYNKKVEAFIAHLTFEKKSFFILDKGRSANETSVVSVLNGIYHGFGFIKNSKSDFTPQELNKCVKSYVDNKDANQIIKSCLHNSNTHQLLHY